MMKTIETANAPQAIGPYSQGKISGGMLYLSGQIPLDPASGAVAGTDITAQTKQVLENIQALLQEAGTDFSAVVKTTCFLADMGDFAAFNAVYERYFTGRPARSCVAVRQLPKNVLVEVELIAET